MKNVIFLKTSVENEVDNNMILNSIFWLLTSAQTKCFGLLFPLMKFRPSFVSFLSLFLLFFLLYSPFNFVSLFSFPSNFNKLIKFFYNRYFF